MVEQSWRLVWKFVRDSLLHATGKTPPFCLLPISLVVHSLSLYSPDTASSAVDMHRAWLMTSRPIRSIPLRYLHCFHQYGHCPLKSGRYRISMVLAQGRHLHTTSTLMDSGYCVVTTIVKDSGVGEPRKFPHSSTIFLLFLGQ